MLDRLNSLFGQIASLTYSAQGYEWRHQEVKQTDASHISVPTKRLNMARLYCLYMSLFTLMWPWLHLSIITIVMREKHNTICKLIHGYIINKPTISKTIILYGKVMALANRQYCRRIPWWAPILHGSKLRPWYLTDMSFYWLDRGLSNRRAIFPLKNSIDTGTVIILFHFFARRMIMILTIMIKQLSYLFSSSQSRSSWARAARDARLWTASPGENIRKRGSKGYERCHIALWPTMG